MHIAYNIKKHLLIVILQNVTNTYTVGVKRATMFGTGASCIAYWRYIRIIQTTVTIAFP